MSNDDKNLNNDPLLLDHDYDGIQELDNPLPNWWLMIFLGTIIFSFNYFLHYSFGGGPNLNQELEVAMQQVPKSTEKVWNEDDLTAKLDLPETLTVGAGVFGAKCGACHGASGEGLIGPNLADKFWLHGEGKRKDIVKVVDKGVTEKGMPAWSGVISEDEVLAVSGYVYSLRKTQPKNPKAPQGQEYQ